MTALFAGLVLFDGWADGSLSSDLPQLPVRGTGLLVLLGVVLAAGQAELGRLIARSGARVFGVVAFLSSFMLAGGKYFSQFWEGRADFYANYLLCVIVLSVVGVFLQQAVRYGTEGVIANCGANFFSIFYLGLFGGFVLGIRIEQGPIALLMFIFVVKSSDIGAYTAGKLFGRHKFSPVISPGKTWEGMAGAVAAAVLVASIFGVCCGIMSVASAVVFGLIFAFIGQLGDLAESMIKRDAEQKDSGGGVPGFGGILDVIDSPLLAAPFAYLFFTVAKGT